MRFAFRDPARLRDPTARKTVHRPEQNRHQFVKTVEQLRGESFRFSGFPLRELKHFDVGNSLFISWLGDRKAVRTVSIIS